MPVRSGLRKRRNFKFFARKSLFLYQDPRPLAAAVRFFFFLPLSQILS